MSDQSSRSGRRAFVLSALAWSTTAGTAAFAQQKSPRTPALVVAIRGPSEIWMNQRVKIWGAMVDPETATYAWQQVGGPQVKVYPRGALNQRELEFEATEAGNVHFRLTVKKGTQTGHASKTVTVKPINPKPPPEPLVTVIHRHLPPGNEPVYPFSRVFATVTVVNAPQGAKPTYKWEQVAGEPVSPKSGSSPSFLIFDPNTLPVGTYVFKVEAQLEDRKGMAEITITVVPFSK